jgi:hypothetical protein
MLPIYREKQAQWIAERGGRQLDAGIRYALCEVIFGGAPQETLDDARLETIWGKISDLSAASLVETLADPVQRTREFTRLLGGSARSARVPS